MALSTAPSPASTSEPRPQRTLRRQLGAHRTVIVVTALVIVAVLVSPTAMPMVARLTLATFVVLLSLTVFTKANEVVVCVGALAVLVVVGASSVRDAADAMTSDTVILLVAAFVVAAAAKSSGLAERMAFAIGGRAGTVDQLMSRITWVLIGTAFLVPSTSGRAALMLPVYLAFAERVGEPKVRRALAVLFPTVILLSAVGSLFGAGAHLVMTELVAGFGEARIGYLEWAVYGLPFAIASSFMALQTVRWMFLDGEERSLAIDLGRTATPWTRTERIVATVVSGVTVLWLAEPVHGIAAWVVAVGGAVLVVIGPFRVVTFGAARRALPLDLVFVMAVTAEAGSALARTGAADWIALTLLGPLTDRAGSVAAVVLVVTLVSLLAHLVVTSRTARASVLLPVVILVGASAGIDVSALAFLSTAAAGYCLTTTTSAKPIRVFATVEDGYGERDLRRLSLRLLPLHVLLLLGFAFVVWPVLGLALTTGAANAPTSPRQVEPSLPWSGSRIDDLEVGPRWAPSPVTTGATPSALDDTPESTGATSGNATSTTVASTTVTTSTSVDDRLTAAPTTAAPSPATTPTNPTSQPDGVPVTEAPVPAEPAATAPPATVTTAPAPATSSAPPNGPAAPPAPAQALDDGDDDDDAGEGDGDGDGDD